MKQLFNNLVGISGFLLTFAGIYNWQKEGFSFAGILDFESLNNPLHMTIIGIVAVIYALFEIDLQKYKRK